MKRFIKYDKIEQFRNVYYEINKFCENINVELPVVNINATEKIHGTNAGFCYSDVDDFWVQSRTKIITPESDNAGCANKAYENQLLWVNIIKELSKQFDIDLKKNIISVFFEWAGGSIQKKSALTGLDKMSIIFEHFKVSPIDEVISDDMNEPTGKWIDFPSYIIVDAFKNAGIRYIGEFPTYKFELDFKNPNETMNNIVLAVENFIEPNSPVGKKLGKDGNTGEGLVCTFNFYGKIYKFKVKGDKHTTSKVIKTKIVDTEEEAKKIKFANDAVTASRVEQAWQKTFGIDNEIMLPTTKGIRQFLDFVVTDVLDEESDILTGLELTPKDVKSYIIKNARNWFLDEMKSI